MVTRPFSGVFQVQSNRLMPPGINQVLLVESAGDNPPQNFRRILLRMRIY